MLRVIILLALSMMTAAVCRAQTPGLADRNSLVGDSTAVVIGTVVEQSMVVRREKMRIDQKAPPQRGQLSLPDPNEYLAGHVFRLLVSEVIKKDGQVRVRKPINIFVPGGVQEGFPALVKNQSFLVLLAPSGADPKKLAGTTLYQPSNPSLKTPFDPKSSYKVVGGEYGAVRVSAENRKIIDGVRQTVRGN